MLLKCYLVNNIVSILNVTMVVMLAVSFFAWWYGRGWKNAWTSLPPRVSGILTLFSVRQLLSTLFAPWRRIVTEPGRALEDRLRAWLDNLISRIIGFFVRLGVLLSAAISVFLVILITLIEMVIWPLIPVAIPVLIILGITHL